MRHELIFTAAALGALASAIGCGDAAEQEGRTALATGEVELAEVPAVRLRDPLAARADSLVRAGRAWRATVLLSAALRAPDGATPEVRLAGARAAAGWSGWSEVDRVLRGAPWLDGEFGGEGRELLVRSALERSADALPDARLALASATSEEARVVRRVLLARAHDRANARDSAASHYLAAAARLPRVGDWLRLRAAGATTDSSDRAALLRRVSLEPARTRVQPTDAQARERAGDLAGAARAYTTAGDLPAAFRVRALAAREPAARAALASDIARFVGADAPVAAVRQALETLVTLDATLPDAAERVVARAQLRTGQASRAVQSFDASLGAGALSSSDLMLRADALARAGRAGEAVRAYVALSGDPAVGEEAAYRAARTRLQSGDGAGARAALRAQRGAAALLLLADLQVDDGDIAGAAATLDMLVDRHPTAAQTPLARFRRGLIAYAADPRTAVARFDTLAARHAGDGEATAARYWAARALARSGDSAGAVSRWRALAAAEPLSYYARQARRRAGDPAWAAPAAQQAAARVPAVDSAAARVAALRSLGMDTEARFELDALASLAERRPAEAGAIAGALATLGDPGRGQRIALAAIARGDASRVVYEAAFPIVHRDALLDFSRRSSLDPSLVAGLIRQESSWNPRATSPVGARGLMQLMPAVGASLARGRGYPVWLPSLLYEPEVSLELGTQHLASSLRRGSDPSRALAAYNAGGSRVTRWTRRPWAGDPELFTEWIPYTETRDYVRIVQRNAGMYAALYGLGN